MSFVLSFLIFLQMATGKPKECPPLTKKQQEGVLRLLEDDMTVRRIQNHNFTTSQQSTTIEEDDKKKTETHGQLPCLVEGCGWAKGLSADKDDNIFLNVGQLYHHLKKKANCQTPSGIAHQETKKRVDRLRIISRGDVSPGYRARPTAAAEVVEEGKGSRLLLIL